MITDKASTPFNIGRAIELTGFQLHEAEVLAQGLSGSAANPIAVLEEVLAWTGGQPFLTQKLCRLVSNLEQPIPLNQEVMCVGNLVQSRIISNWETQDEPEHLRTIRDRILCSNRRKELLSLYEKIKSPKSIGGEVKANDTPEQIDLRLSGLVVKHQNKLVVYNRIYAAVFDLTWINTELKSMGLQLLLGNRGSQVEYGSIQRIRNIQALLDGSAIPEVLSRKLNIDLLIADDKKLQQFLQWLDEKSGSLGFSMIVLQAIHFQEYAATINRVTKLRGCCG